MFNRTLAFAGLAALIAAPGMASADDTPAAPAAAAPAAAPAGTPLSKLLDASGITVSDYFDMAYSHASQNIDPAKGGVCDRAFDCQNDSVTLHQFGLQIAKQPKEGFGGLVNITAGKDANVLASYPYNGSASGQIDVTQAYGQYATGPWTVIAGKFTTLHGSEVIWAPSNSNYSRSLLFFAEPLTHTGARATYAASDTVSLIFGVNNGWDQISAHDKGRTVELGATLTPIKPVSITLSGYSGKAITVAGNDGTRTSLNFVATYNVIDPLTLGVEYLDVSQDNWNAAGDKAKYDGYALYATYMFTPQWRGALRAESLDDKDGYLFSVPGTKVSEATATLSWLYSDNFELRGEVREDHGSNAIFTDNSTPPALGKSLTTYAVEALFKF